MHSFAWPPPLASCAEEDVGFEQVVFALEMLVEATNGHACHLHDIRGPNSFCPIQAKALGGRFDDALPTRFFVAYVIPPAYEIIVVSAFWQDRGETIVQADKTPHRRTKVGTVKIDQAHCEPVTSDDGLVARTSRLLRFLVG
ncbi:hypothetical protein [Acidisarcina polymorpha]|uniref:hypothetical protein n=1 Tax=Acidisarcina polymorpha TaxID=2211140 RepID=UPI001F38B3CC|nr:hypothetical protein [Acidisarcina polymorpha]